MKNFNLKGIKAPLKRSQMKNIIAGLYEVGGGGDKYMCCWTGSAICSACQVHTSAATCVSGATLTAC